MIYVRMYDFAKRIFDVAVSFVAIVLTAPLQVITAIVIRLRLGSPVFFRQRRPGKDGKIFQMIKFRTMLEPTKSLVTDEQRMTRLGRFLRSTSLDELPTLWNVLKGDMSIVGPRPLLESYLAYYSPEQARRHEVRPGVTGLAQVKGRNSISWEDRFQFDVEYVDQRSLGLDLKILLATVKSVLKRDGINHEGHATMPPFDEQFLKNEKWR